MAQQYQAYSKATYGDTPTQSSPQAQTPLPSSYAHSTNPYLAQYPQQSTFVPPPHGKMAGMQQPDMANQTQQSMSEKSQLPMPVHAHENAQRSYFGRNWTFGLFDCFGPCSTCKQLQTAHRGSTRGLITTGCLGCWCPCLLFGKTYAREHGDGETSGCGAMVSSCLVVRKLRSLMSFSAVYGILLRVWASTPVCSASSGRCVKDGFD